MASSTTQDHPTIVLNNLRFDTITPVSEHGFGLVQKQYAAGRLAVKVNHFGGINQIEHWGAQPGHMSKAFFTGNPASSYQRCFRAQVVVDGEPYNLAFAETAHFPFGYRSRFAIPERGVELIHRLNVLDDTLVFSIEVLRNRRHLPLCQRIEHHDYSFAGTEGRRCGDWEAGIIPSGWVLTVTDTTSDERWKQLQAVVGQKDDVDEFPACLTEGHRHGRTLVGLLGAGGLAMKATQSGRRYFTGKVFRRGEQACSLVFAADREALGARAAVLARQAAILAKAQERDHSRALAAAPEFHTGDRVFDSMLANAPSALKALAIADIPGGARAASYGYWIWGWDTLTCADAYLLSGQTAFARDVLRFYRDTAHARWGVGHQFTMEKPPRVRIPMPPAAQMIFPIFLHQYGIHSGDTALWREMLPFLRQLFAASLRAVNAQGLGLGRALWPDHPKFCRHNGHDISVFNNSIQYQGLRSIAAIAATLGDQATVDQAQRICRLMETHFVPTFWNAKRGYFADSVDARTGEQRPCYPAHALLWMTPFLNDLLSGAELAAGAGFIAEHHATSRGFLPYPRWDPAFDGDGNQLGQVWPTPDMFVTRCQAAAGRQDVLEGWIASSDWYWKQMTFIEGYTAQTVNDSGTPDSPGSWCAFFGAKTTYLAFLTGCAGIHIDVGGITLSEGLARPLRIARLPCRKASLDIALKGEGMFARRLLVNGKPLVGTLKIPAPLLKGKVRIVHERTAKAPAHPVILSMYGAELRSVSLARGVLRAAYTAATPVWLRYHAAKPAKVLVDGREIDAAYDPATRMGKALLPASAKPATIDIGG